MNHDITKTKIQRNILIGVLDSGMNKMDTTKNKFAEFILNLKSASDKIHILNDQLKNEDSSNPAKGPNNGAHDVGNRSRRSPNGYIYNSRAQSSAEKRNNANQEMAHNYGDSDSERGKTDKSFQQIERFRETQMKEFFPGLEKQISITVNNFETVKNLIGKKLVTIEELKTQIAESDNFMPFYRGAVPSIQKIIDRCNKFQKTEES